jgi:hypothetical protein
MKIPAFHAEVTSNGSHYRERRGNVITEPAAVVMAGLPPECQRPGASRPWTDTSCWGVVQMCQDKCSVYNPQDPFHPQVVSGSWYVCGACFGFPW